MARPRSENPRDKQVSLRITERQASLLDAVASLSEEEWVALGLDPSLHPKDGSPSALGALIIGEFSSELEQDPDVQTALLARQMRADDQATHLPPVTNSTR